MTISEDDRQRIIEEERVRAEARATAEAEVKQKAGANTAKGCLGCFGALVLGAVAITSFAYLSRDNSPPAEAGRALSQARSIVTVLCENAVENRLRAPASADFPFANGTNVAATGANTYRLASYVDAQNGFGAMIRSNFVCEVSGSGAEISNYSITNLVMQ